MQRAVAFWSRISESKRFADQFALVADQFNRENAAAQADYEPIGVPTRHVDGTDRIASRREDVRWLKETPPTNECRVLTNAKCLTEGVDVPALDAVMFLKPRRSKIDIVQAVGRVMRKPPGKEIGYIILPIAIPAGRDPAAALDRNDDYDVVWDVLQALRSHDERFNAYINRIALRSEEPGDDPDAPIEIIDATPPQADDESEGEVDAEALQGRLFTHEDWVGAIYTKIVAKVGTRTYWEDWADDVVDIANRHRDRINAILDANPDAAAEFDRFLTGLHSILNDGITRDNAIAMLSQHLITSPIFEALFGSDVFEANNPVAQTMQRMVDTLETHHLDTETRNLNEFYRSVQRRVEGIPASDGHARQTIIKDLYGRFFKKAFPHVADSLGIVYTPLEVVDFMIRATQAALTQHFDASLSDEGVHILDPFTGTGTFMTRLLQSGYIDPADLQRKYREEIHANEILLLAYYIAAVNIETTYNQLTATDQEDPPTTPSLASFSPTPSNSAKPAKAPAPSTSSPSTTNGPTARRPSTSESSSETRPTPPASRRRTTTLPTGDTQHSTPPSPPPTPNAPPPPSRTASTTHTSAPSAGPPTASSPPNTAASSPTSPTAAISTAIQPTVSASPSPTSSTTSTSTTSEATNGPPENGPARREERSSGPVAGPPSPSCSSSRNPAESRPVVQPSTTATSATTSTATANSRS
jgi:predicted helicase